MSQMFDLIKQSAVPAAMMRSAAKGALSVSPDEMIEILVYLTGNPVFGQQAAMTLASWDEAVTLKAVSGPAPQEVLDYFWAEINRRPKLMPALIENPRISEEKLVHSAANGSREFLDMLKASPRAQSSSPVLEAMLENPRIRPNEIVMIRASLGLEPAASNDEAPVVSEQEAEAVHGAWLKDHEHEVAAEEGKAFELVGADKDDDPKPPDAAEPSQAAPAARVVPQSMEDRKSSAFLKVFRLNVSGRVKLAFLGNKEERSLLIRDGARIVQNAVLSSPKLTEAEVEMFANLKNVQENVLREISRNRRFIRNYSIIVALVNNPKCPLDLSLTLIKNVRIGDLKTLQINKNVPDTLRQVAFKLYRQKAAQSQRS